MSQGATPANNATSATAEPEAAANSAATKQYSYGGSPLSVLFTLPQVEQLKQAIRTFEDAPTASTVTNTEVPTLVQPVIVEKISEPATYPVFYLSSIVYRAPEDWSIWISGHKLTSEKNETDVKVVAVSPDSVTLTWKPTYTQAIGQRKTENKFAASDDVKNKLAQAQRVSYDDKSGTVTFSLRQNQSFSVGYFKLFEGYMESPTLPAIVASNDPVGDAADDGEISAVSPNSNPNPSASPNPNPVASVPEVTVPTTR